VIREGIAYVGGQFYMVGSSNLSLIGVAAFDSDDTGAAETGFDAGVSCPDFSCDRLVVDLETVGNVLYVGGNFTRVGVNAASGLAAVQVSTGSRMSQWTPSLTSPHNNIRPSVTSLALRDLTLYAGGYFTSIAFPDATGNYPSFLARLPALPIPPAAPTGVAATAGDASAAVTWTPGFDGGTPVTRVEFALDDTTSVDDSTAATSSPYTLTGLTNGTTYTVYVRLANSAGVGTWSLASAAFTPEAPPTPAAPDSPPGAPTDVRAMPGNTSATVSWTAPTDRGTSGVHRYVVRAQPGGRTCSTSSTSCIVEGLTNGTAYSFTVTAWNTTSPGPTSTASAPVTPRTVPGTPVKVTAMSGVEKAAIAWVRPTDDGGSAITGYRVSTTPATAGCVTASATTCTLTDLTAGREYAVTVAAINAAGASQPSSPVTVTPRAKATIVISGSRSGKRDATVTIQGTVRGDDVSEVQPYFRLGRDRGFTPALVTPQVDKGAFTWQRVTTKRLIAYVVAGGIKSNRVTVAPR
jgi:hypothetical protein